MGRIKMIFSMIYFTRNSQKRQKMIILILTPTFNSGNPTFVPPPVPLIDYTFIVPS